MRNDPNMRDRSTDLGAVRINNGVLMSIAAIAATEVRGIARMGGSKDIFRVIGNYLTASGSTQGVKVVSVDGAIRLVVSVVVEYGVDIPRAADEVQENVKRTVERMTGVTLAEVNVIVEGVSGRSSERI